MKLKLYAILLCLLIVDAASLRAQTLDQSQLNYNSGLSARTLSGYSVFQSFTAGIDGQLTRIDMGFFNYINGVGTLKIYSGTDTTGILLNTYPVSVYCPSGSCFVSFNISVPISVGQSYTFEFTPGAGIPDPYGVQLQCPGTYSAGQYGLIDPGGMYFPGCDFVFRTYVGTASGISDLNGDASDIKIYPNPFSEETNIEINTPANEITITLTDSYGRILHEYKPSTGQKFILKRGTLASGQYFVIVSDSNKLISSKKLIIID